MQLTIAEALSTTYLDSQNLPCLNQLTGINNFHVFPLSSPDYGAVYPLLRSKEMQPAPAEQEAAACFLKCFDSAFLVISAYVYGNFIC